MSRLSFSVFGFLIFHSFLFAIEIPHGVNKELLGASSSRDFFLKRLSNKTCRENLTTFFSKIKEDKDSIKSWLRERDGNISDEEIRKLEIKIKNKDADLKVNRIKFAQFVRECGPCSVSMKPEGTKTPFSAWFVSEGSCQFLEEDLEWMGIKKKLTAKEFFKGARREILSPANYEKRFDEKNFEIRGSSHLLKFTVFDPKTAKAIAFGPDEEVKEFPFVTFIAVRAPLQGLNPTAITYFVENFDNRKEKPSSEVEFQFQSIPEPAGFKKKDPSFLVVDYNVFGEKEYPSPVFPIPTLRKEDPQVKGLWYANEDGAFRYWTAANLSVVGFLKPDQMVASGEFVHTDMLFEFYQNIIRGLAL